MRNEAGRAFARGAIASVAGLIAMDLYSRAVQRAMRRGSSNSDGSGEEGGAGEGPLDDVSLVGQQSREDEPATETLARIAYEKLQGSQPSAQTRKRLGQAVHWGYGVAAGGLYGIVQQMSHSRDLPAGAGYGTALWLLGDELAIPVLGLAKGPTGHSPHRHAQAFGAHLVYGLATSATARALRRIM
jgi:hypothetical protein